MSRGSIFEQADRLGRKRARMLPFLAVLFLSQQVTYFSTINSPRSHVAQMAGLAWVALALILLAALATNGFWFQPKAVRDLLDDENTRANRLAAMRAGFLAAMGAAVLVYVDTLFDSVSGRDAVHFIMSVGIAVALISWGAREKRAHLDA